MRKLVVGWRTNPSRVVNAFLLVRFLVSNPGKFQPVINLVFFCFIFFCGTVQPRSSSQKNPNPSRHNIASAFSFFLAFFELSFPSFHHQSLPCVFFVLVVSALLVVLAEVEWILCPTATRLGLGNLSCSHEETSCNWVREAY